MDKDLIRYTGYIEGRVMEVLREAAKKEERPVVYMINRLIKNYCNELESSK